ncbi:MAG: hypothetical protein F7C82_05805 [Desulfurococcales archaeon]|nr:hypothetical protein [Desulfurococcales archaeon]
MPRKGGRLDEEAAEMGRYIGTLERTGYKELIDEVRAQAKAEGKTLTDKLAEVIKTGLTYEKYKDLTLADAMKVMDFIERFFRNFLYPVMYSAGMFQVQANIDQMKAIAQALGYVPREYAERLAEQKLAEYAQAMEEQMKQEQEQQQQQGKGPLSTFIEKLAEVLAERIGEATIERLVESGKLDEFLETIGDVALRAAGSVLSETGAGAGGGGEGG